MRFSAIVRKVLEKERRIKIVILGPDNAGKTSLLNSFMGKPVSDIAPTFGYQIISKSVSVKDKEYLLEILDVGGQHAIRAYWDTYYACADGVLFVYDNTDKERHRSILEATVSHPTLRTAVFMCAANKSEDVSNEIEKEIAVSRYIVEKDVGFDFVKEMKQLSLNKAEEHYTIPIVYTSAKTGKNVNNIFTGLLERIIEKRAENGIL